MIRRFFLSLVAASSLAFFASPAIVTTAAAAQCPTVAMNGKPLDPARWAPGWCFKWAEMHGPRTPASKPLPPKPVDPAPVDPAPVDPVDPVDPVEPTPSVPSTPLTPPTERPGAHDVNLNGTELEGFPAGHYENIFTPPVPSLGWGGGHVDAIVYPDGTAKVWIR